MIRYIRYNSNNDIEYLKLLRQEAQDYSRYEDNIYQEKIYGEACQRLERELKEGGTPEIETIRVLDPQVHMRLVKETDNWFSLTPEEKHKKIQDAIDKYPGKTRLEPKISTSYNWDTHHLKEFIRLLNREIDVLEKGGDTEGCEAKGSYKIANGKKTDFIKIISAMYDLRMFETSDGKIADNKEDLLKAFGSIFDEDFSTYSTLLSRAKANSANFLDVFDHLKQKGETYYYDEKKK